jgi:hypothetical protein
VFDCSATGWDEFGAKRGRYNCFHGLRIEGRFVC